MTPDPAPPPGLIDRLNRISDIEYSFKDTDRNRLLRQRASIRRKMTLIERKAARLWADYRELGELLEATNDQLERNPQHPW